VSLSRRQFFSLLLAVFLLPRLGRADQSSVSAAYHADVGILFNLFTFSLEGSVEEQVDLTAGHYRVLVAGEGARIANRIESAGVVRNGRFFPTTTALFFMVRGRESRTQISYDYGQGLIRYRHASQTFLLRRRRIAEDVLRIPAGQPVDDIVTSVLNFAEGILEREGDKTYRTLVVRRPRREREGPDEVQTGRYGAEIVPLRFTVTGESEGGRPVCLLDLTGFSAWATSDPARIVFGPNRRPESIQASLMLGTSVRITFDAAS